MASKHDDAASERGLTGPRPARDKPDPRPARLMVAAGAVAAVTIMGAGLVEFPLAAAEEPSAVPAVQQTERTAVTRRPVTYVRLKPGQKAPKGAKVIKEAAPTPRVVVQRIVASTPSRSASRAVVRSRQSGG